MKDENEEAVEDTHYLIALPSYVYRRKPKFNKLGKESLTLWPSIQKPLTLKPLPSRCRYIYMGDTYENAKLCKELTKRWHDRHKTSIILLDPG